MLNELQSAKQRWGGRVDLIDRWLDDRQQLLVRYMSLVKEDKQSHLQALPDHEQLQYFCDALVDYISLGHFEVFDSLITKQVESDLAEELKQKSYPEISQTTKDCLDFNDRYQEASDDFSRLEDDLSRMGEILANRFELEDQLLEQLYQQSPCPAD